MDGTLWRDLGWLVLWNLVAPTAFWLTPLRFAATMVVAAKYHWLLATVTCTLSGTAGMMMTYQMADWLRTLRFTRRILVHPKVRRLNRRMRLDTLTIGLAIALHVVELGIALIASGKRCTRRQMFVGNLVGRTLHTLPIALAGALAAQFPWVHQLLHGNILTQFPWYVRAVAVLHTPWFWLVVGGIGLLWWRYQKQRQATSDLTSS